MNWRLKLKRGNLPNEFGGTHPKQPGNRLCADMHQRLFELAWSGSVPTNTRKHALPPSLLDKNSYSRGRFLSPSKVDLQEGWKFSEPEWQEISGSKRSRYLGFPLLHTEDSGKEFIFNLRARLLGLLYSLDQMQEKLNIISIKYTKAPLIYITTTARIYITREQLCSPII